MLSDTEEIYKLKKVIEELDDLDRAILIMYSDLQSMAKTGKKFGVSAATIYTHIQRIRKQIIEKI